MENSTSKRRRHRRPKLVRADFSRPAPKQREYRNIGVLEYWGGEAGASQLAFRIAESMVGFLPDLGVNRIVPGFRKSNPASTTPILHRSRFFGAL
jgi:hypothetical protein